MSAMASTPQSNNAVIYVQVLKATDLPLPLLSKLPNPFVKLKLEQNSFQTKAIKRTQEPTWNEGFYFTNVQVSTPLSLKVIHHGTIKDQVLGEIKVDIRPYLQQEVKDIVLQLHTQDNVPSGTVTIRISESNPLSAAKTNLGRAQEVEAAMTQSPLLGAIGPPMDAISGTSDIGTSLVTICSKIDALGCYRRDCQGQQLCKSVQGSNIPQIHPFANLAWQAVSQAYKVVKGQLDRDAKISGLVRSMEDLYSFVDRIEELKKHPSFEKVVEKILKQTIECANFMQKYGRHKFLGRAVQQIIVDWDSKVSEFIEVFARLHKCFDTELSVEIATVTFRISATVDTIKINQNLSKLGRIRMDASMRPHCLPNTRVDVIKSITKWATSGSDQNILWLWGLAGAGKSTISTTIAEMFREFGQLGAFLFFNRDVKKRNDPSNTIRTLAFQLASYHPAIGEAISKAIDRTPSISEAALQLQFRALLSEPLSTISLLPTLGPVIIVIDSLDECGDLHSRAGLLSLLSQEAASLPSPIRILITSRPEKDIRNAFGAAHIKHIKSQELDVTSPTSIQDVGEFIRHQLVSIRDHDLDPDWPGDANIKELALRANGLFIWASTACLFIGQYPPDERLQIILASHPGMSNPLSAVDDIYAIALTTACPRSNARFWEDSCRVLGIILTAHVPLSIGEIDALLQNERGKSCHRLTSSLGSVLQDQHGVISTLHKSFHDFLTGGATLADPWHIDIELHNLQLAEHCIKLLNGNLKENICELTLTLDGFDATVPKNITYATLYWIEHVCAITVVPLGLGNILHDLLRHHAMHWLEAMSLMRKSRIATRLFQQLSGWLRRSLSNQLELQSMVHDLYRFSSTFPELIEEHPLLIYRAALPFTPHETTLYKLFYQPHMPLVKGLSVAQSWPPLLLTIASGDPVCAVAVSPDGTRIVSSSNAIGNTRVRVWDATTGSQLLSPFQGQTDWALSIAFSPDGTRIVSGSSDKTIRVWNATTGSELLSPFQGHVDGVLSVAFSPDGSNIMLGSSDKTIRVWDGATGSELLSQFQGNTHCINSVSFSPDGKRVVPGSSDETIEVWDATTYNSEPCQGHQTTISSVAFSPDGTRVVSGSDVIRVWDVNTGLELLSPFQGHTDWILSLAFSPDGTRIVSGSSDKTIRVWNATTGSELLSPFQGHTDSIWSVAFSPDGTRIVSGSPDNTIRVWDATTTSHSELLPSFQGHTDMILSGAFSPDGTRIVSGSFDKTIRVWDVTTGSELLPPFQGHTAPIWSVAFSPDGTRIVSGSADNTIRLWNSTTGSEVLAPFQGHTACIWSVAFAPDGTRIVSGSDDNTIRVWDVTTGSELLPPFQRLTHWKDSVVFSPDGATIVSYSHDNIIRLWNASTGQELISYSSESEVKELPLVSLNQRGNWIIHAVTGQAIFQFPAEVWKKAEFGSILAVSKSEKDLLIIQFHDLYAPT